jgi:hypothetical protein
VVGLIEKAVGKPAIRELFPMQPGDVPETCADVSDLERGRVPPQDADRGGRSPLRRLGSRLQHSTNALANAVQVYRSTSRRRARA